MIRRCIRDIGPLVLWAAFSLFPTSSFGQQCDPQGQSGGCCLANGTYAPAGSPCNDGNPRTVDSCNAKGICVGVYPQAATCALGATYNQQTGVCVANSRPSPMCGDGNVDPGEQCDNGSKCSNGTDCTGNPGVCSDGTCQPAAGNCCTASCTFASAGTTCDDGNGCTPTDTCDGNGTCVGSGQVDCEGSDACHPGSNFCTPATGSCSTCRDPNNVQDQSYCSADTGQCVSNVQACAPHEIDSQGNPNLCHTNSGQDPKTGECLYQPKFCTPIPGDCNIQSCQPSTGQCVETQNPGCFGSCNDPTFPDTPCFSGTCIAEGCSFDPNGLPNCDIVVTPECGVDHNSCVSPNGCVEGVGCSFIGVACDLPTNPCQEVVRTPEASTCCNYQVRDCAAEFGNTPNYVYSCDPTPGSGGCRALHLQTITFNTPGPQLVGTMLNLVASASSGLTVSFASKTPAVCTVSGTTANLLMTGTCVIEATQPGSPPQPGKPPYAAATPVDVSFLVQSLQAQAITFTTAPPTSAAYNSSFTVAATGGASGNSVTFTSSGVCTNSGAIYTMTSGTGTCSVIANQAGNSNYSAAPQVTKTITAALASQTINFPAIPTQSGPGMVTLTATASSGLTVSYGVTSGPATVSGNILTTTSVGSITVQANQAGNANYAAATPVSETFTVNANAGGLNGKNCNGEYTGMYKGSLTVTSGQTCTFTSGSITGNLTQTGGTVVLENGSSVGGNLQTSGGSLSITNSTVGNNLQVSGAVTFSIGPGVSIGGSLQIQSLPVSAGTDQVCGASIKGNLTLQNSGTAVLLGSAPGCAGNTTGGDFTVQSNTASTTIDNNTVGGNLIDQNNTAATQVFTNGVTKNLQCNGNSSISGAGNTAGNKQGQCAKF